MKNFLKSQVKKQLKIEVETIKNSNYLIKTDIIELDFIQALLNNTDNRIEILILDNDIKKCNEVEFISQDDNIYKQFKKYFSLYSLVEFYYFNIDKNLKIYINDSCISDKLELFEKLNQSEVLTSSEIKDIILKMYNL